MIDGSRPAVFVDQTAAVAALRIAPAAAALPGGPEPALPDEEGHTVNVLSGHGNQVAQAGSIGHVTFQLPQPVEPPDSTPWLRVVWELAARWPARVELRFHKPLAGQRIRTYLLVRAPSADAAADLIVQLGQYLPRQLRGDPVVDRAVLGDIRAPFQPDPRGLAEIGKRVTARRTSRGDASTPWLTAVTPWRRPGRPAWPALWAEMLAQPGAVVVSVGLLPFRVGDNLKINLQARAAELGFLAQPGPSPVGSVFGRGRAPDQFAVAAAPVLADAVGRYTDQVFQIRVSVATDRPLPDHLAHQLALAVSPGRPDAGLAGLPARVLRPVGPEALVAWRNLTELGFDPLPGCLVQGLPPEAFGPVERTLSAIASLDEAAAACQLPYHAERPLFE